jgi:hypothetical protein
MAALILSVFVRGRGHRKQQAVVLILPTRTRVPTIATLFPYQNSCLNKNKDNISVEFSETYRNCFTKPYFQPDFPNKTI